MKKEAHPKLNQFFATAICGNDILSSALYVSGIAIIFAGVYAPLVLAIIALVLFFYKSVYTEVVEALPINGGAYNCLLNGTSKTVAAVAGVTTILSYIATAVISAKTGVEYLHTILPVPITLLTVGLLLFFAFLVITGIKDSAKVALGIFVLHIVALTAFLVLGLLFYLQHGNHLFLQNLQTTQHNIMASGGIWKALFFGFSASLLGVSGFESSANFVEEQQRGVFRKTLRNMAIGIAIFNPLIALVVLGCSPIDFITASKDFLLSEEARMLGGSFFQYFIVIDAFLVLAGAVLTSYVGVSGLIYRMASDACLPGFLTKQNKRGAYPRIIVTFFLLCTSILLITQGNLLALAGVYTIAFLCVMSLFALGNLILRETRTDLKRTYRAPLPFIAMAFIATTIGIIGNIRIDSHNLTYFSFYFLPALFIVLGIINMDYNISILLRLSKPFPWLHEYIHTHFESLNKGTLVAFVHNVNRLFEILRYVNRNETGWHIILVHCNNDDGEKYDESFEEIAHILPILKKAGVYPYFNIQLYYLNKPFGPAVIEEVAHKFKVDKNKVLIGSIHEHHPFEYSDLGGVRIIF